MKKQILLLALSSCIFLNSCKEDEIETIVPKQQIVSGKATLTQKSFTSTVFDGGKPIKANVVQEFEGTIGVLGNLSAVLNVELDLITGKSGQVSAIYTDTSGNKINTLSSSIGSEKGLTISEKITGGTGKFSNISGGGTYFINLDRNTGNGSGVLSWTVVY
jgi:hypothetical protein